jgi:hypothetical protein
MGHLLRAVRIATIRAQSGSQMIMSRAAACELKSQRLLFVNKGS